MIAFPSELPVQTVFPTDVAQPPRGASQVQEALDSAVPACSLGLRSCAQSRPHSAGGVFGAMWSLPF